MMALGRVVWVVQICEEWEGVGEERAGTVRERGYDVAYTWRVGGWPRGIANVCPKCLLR